MVPPVPRAGAAPDPETAAAPNDPLPPARGPSADVRFPPLAAPIPPIVALGVVGAIVLGAFVVVWVATDDVVRFYLVAAVVAGVVGLSLVVWNEL